MSVCYLFFHGTVCVVVDLRLVLFGSGAISPEALISPLERFYPILATKISFLHVQVIAKINFQNLKFVKCIEAKENTKTRTNMLNQSVIVGIHTVHAESTVLHQKRWKIRISIF